LANTDNRKSQRSPVTLRIKFKSATLEQFIERYAVDVSQGGIFIRTKEPLPVGTTMRFEFQLRDESPLITGEGTVVWIREQNAGQSGVAPGMGVRFDRLTEASQGVLDEILAHKAARGANGSHDSVDMPTRVVATSSMHKGRGPQMQFAPDAVPEEAFEQATKVHSLEELASLSARADTGEQTRRMAAQELGITDYAESEDDKTKVYPALAKPGARASTGPRIDLGTSGSTQPLPPMPGPQSSDVELGRAGYEEDLDDDELPFDTRDARDMELGLAGPTSPLQHERLVRPDEVELGHAGTTQPLSQARASARPAAPGKPIALGESGAFDPMSEVPLPEAGHYDLGMAGPTMTMPAERLTRGSELELGAAGGTDEADVTPREPAQRPAQRGAQASAAAAARAAHQAARPVAPVIAPIVDGGDTVDDAIESLEETHDRLAPVVPVAAAAAARREPTDELAARRARRDSERLPSAAEGEVAAESQAGDELAERPGDETLDVDEAAATVDRQARSTPIVRVSTARTGTEGVGGEKRSSFLPLIAAAALVVIIGGGALYMFTRDDGSTGPNPDPTAVAPPPKPTPTVEPLPTPPQPTTQEPTTQEPATPPQPTTDTAMAGARPDAGAAAGSDAEIVFEEPEVPVETVSVQVRSTPPGATAALVDGDQSGPTPMTFTVDKSKKHRVRLSHPGFASQEIEIDPARPRPAPVTLAPIPWVMRIESTPPGATIYVDGRRVLGHTPNDFVLPRGMEKQRQYKVSFRLPGYDKLDIVIHNEFQPQGESMAQTVQGTLVKSAVPVRPRPQPRPPAGGNQVTPPPGDTGETHGPQPPPSDTPPPAGDTQPPPPADSPEPEPPPAGEQAPSSSEP
jgi:uncharacterized protein (TIGR02266 family)